MIYIKNKHYKTEKIMSEEKSEKKTATAKPASTKSEASKIWEDIKDVRVEMFSLPNQTVKDYCKPIDVDPSKLYLVIDIGSFINALESAVGSKYNIDRAEKYVIVSVK